MDISTIILWLITLVFLFISFKKDGAKTKKALKMALNMGKGMAISIFSIILAIGLILTFLPPTEIASFVNKQSLFLATVGSALLGTITLVPAFIAFPLIGTLVDAGVGTVPSVAFLTTLTMVGLVTFPLEKKEFGTKFTLVRNGFSFVFAIVIALVMGVII
ncbi:permease [Gallicola sp. Sow4_E12]|uniref:permease n=1 Tax=Gallicola sp. Sow4_E12 TaxID=3438785 RepID=UPI003F8E1118